MTKEKQDGIHVALYGRKKDIYFVTSEHDIENEIAELDKSAFASEDDLIWFALNRLSGGIR
jgi:hypothetical protein